MSLDMVVQILVSYWSILEMYLATFSPDDENGSFYVEGTS